MPRSFMITNRRYRTVVEYDSRDGSPEPSEIYFTPFNCSMSDKTPSNGGSSSFDFYTRFHRLSGLEQLAEISLATAHRWNPSPPSSPETAASSDASLYSDSSQSSTSGNNSSNGSRRLLFHHHHHRHHHRLHRQSKVERLRSTSPQSVTTINNTQTAINTSNDEDVDTKTSSDLQQPLALVSKMKECEKRSSDSPKKELWDNCVDKGELKLNGGVTSNMCPECGKRYSTSSNLARHRQTHRSMEDKKARKCPHCDKVYVSMPAYSMHVRTHNQGCQCPFCGKCYSRPWLLQGHIRTHTGEKPFKCQVCNKAFADKSNLRAHVQTHSDTKPFVCQRCGKAFALKSYLYKHEESSCMRAHASSGATASLQQQQPRTVTSDVKLYA